MRRLAVWLGLLLAPPLMAGGFALSGVGLRALGMGGAYRAVSSDWASVFWNPAGLADLEETTLDVVSSFILPTGRYQMNTGLLGYDGGYALSSEVTAREKLFVIPSGGYARPMGDGLGGAFSVFIPFGLGAGWDLYHPPLNYYLSFDPTYSPPEFPNPNWESEISVIAAFIGVGKRLSDVVSVGIAAGPIYGNLLMKKVSLVPTGAPFPYQDAPVLVNLQGSGFGYGGALGFNFDLREDLRLALTARAYSDLTLDGDGRFSLYLPRNDGLRFQDTLFFSGEVLNSTASTSATIPLPANIGLGISWMPSERLTLAFDVDWTGWERLKRVPVEIDHAVILQDTLTGDTLDFEWSSTYRFSLGLEYLLTPDFFVRGGIYYDPSPIPDHTLTPLLPDVNAKFSYNLGVTYNLGAFGLNLHYEYVQMKERTVDRGADFNPQAPYMPGTYRINIQSLGVGVTYYF